jgi:predicted permease
MPTSWLIDLLTDMRFGSRMLRRSPGFALAAILTLALGIGANTAMFSVADGLLLRPPPFEHPEGLYWIYEVNATLRLTTADAVPDSPANFLDWRRDRRVFDYMIAWRNWFYSVAGVGGQSMAPEQVRGVMVSPGFFEMLGVRTFIGRTFRPDEEEPGRDDVVVLTHGFWQRHFGGDSAIVGQSVLVDGRRRMVIGVLQDDFYFIFRDSALFVPMTVDREFRNSRTTHNIVVLARLAPGATASDGQSDLDRIGRDLQLAYPTTNDAWGPALVPVFPMNKNLRPALLMLLGAVALVLLIACINVGNLLLARARARQREVTVRTALGASRNRLVRQMLAESALLAAVGAMIALPLAAVAIRTLTSFLPDVRIAGAGGVTIDIRVLTVTFALTLTTTALLGTFPALQSTRSDQLRVFGSSQARARAGMALLAVEIALSLMLLFGATLLVRSLWNLQRVDPGFRPDRLITMQLWLPGTRYPNAESVSLFYQEVLRRIHSLSDVTATAVVNTRPFLGWSLGARFQAPGQASSAADDPIIDFRVITPGYLSALGVRLVRGRDIQERDGLEAAPVALINTTMARRFWPAGEPIGDVIRLKFLGANPSGPWLPERTADAYTVVGVLGDVQESRLGDKVRPVVYLSQRQNPSRYGHLLVRTGASSTSGVLNSIRRQLESVDPDLGVYDVQSMTTVMEQAVAAPRLNSLLLSIFAATALLLCGVGVYGVTSYIVARRTREFAIRLAIGGSPSTILQMVSRQGAAVALIGIAIGIGGALMLGSTLASLVYGVAPRDGVTLLLSSVVVFVVATVACYVPAWHATRVEPLAVLRAE